jgi:hypothetical protein
MADDQPALPLCPECREPMKLIRTIPKLGGMRQLSSYYCAPCGVAETKEQEDDT